MSKASATKLIKARRASVVAHSREVYQIIKKTSCRAGCEMDSDKSGTLAVGEVIEVLETKGYTN